MKMPSCNGTRRRGAIVPLAAVLLTLLVGMLAFAIDIGYIATVRAEMQNAADAAALAAAQRLQEPFVQFYSPGQKSQSSIYSAILNDTTTATSAICTAQQVASSNKAGGVSITVPASDVTFSYWDGQNSAVTPSYPNQFPNSVTVVVRRDNVANGPVGLFFAQIFGISTIQLTASARATIFAGDVSSLKVIPGVNAHILPVALDVNYWKTYATTGKSPDGNIVNGPNGNPQLHVYPYPGNAPGSFGLLDVGPPQNNAPAFRSWIDTGETPNDISYLQTNSLVPVTQAAPKQWKCGPGLKSTLLANFQSVMGKANLLPLFAPVTTSPYLAATSNGQSATYAIVGFIGVTVTQAQGNGDNMDISVQPMAMVDPTALISSPKPATGTSLTQFGTFQTTFVSAKLTQ